MSKRRVIDKNNVMYHLERLATAFPWDKVELEIERKPEGELNVCAQIHSNDDMGFPFQCHYSETVEHAVDELIRRQQAQRDPEILREKKLKQLREQIAKLEAADFSIPPYVPNRELAEFSSVVDV